MSRFIIILSGLMLAFVPLQVEAGGFVDIKSRGATVPILVQSPSKTQPVAIAVLFTGGDGILKIEKTPFGRTIRNSENFLIRSRAYFLDNDLMTVSIDGPTDVPGSLDGFRGSEDHAEDVATVIAYLRKNYNLPVWLVGTSRGTNSVANAAIRLQGAKGPDGIVLTSTLTGDNPRGDHVLLYNLDQIRIPVVIAHHKKDLCSVTDPNEIGALKAALKNAKILATLWYDGGVPSGRSCEPHHYHGFIKIEATVVTDIANTIKKTILRSK